MLRQREARSPRVRSGVSLSNTSEAQRPARARARVALQIPALAPQCPMPQIHERGVRNLRLYIDTLVSDADPWLRATQRGPSVTLEAKPRRGVATPRRGLGGSAARQGPDDERRQPWRPPAGVLITTEDRRHESWGIREPAHTAKRDYVRATRVS